MFNTKVLHNYENVLNCPCFGCLYSMIAELFRVGSYLINIGRKSEYCCTPLKRGNQGAEMKQKYVNKREDMNHLK